MRDSAWVPWAFTLCALTLGCDGAVSPRQISLKDFAAHIAAVQCGVRSQCTGRPLEATDQDCVSQTTVKLQSTLVGQIAAAIARQTAVFDERKAAVCIDDLKTAGCARFDTLLPDACLAAIGGKGIVGAACVSEFDCAAENFCSVGDQCPGVCNPRGRDVMTECVDDRSCGPGLRCPEIGGKCAVPLAAGAACDVFGKPCAFGYSCFSPTILDPGTCEPVVKAWSSTVGETCAILASFFCAPGLSCPVLSDKEGELPVCKAAAPSGAKCTIGLPDPCPANEYCEGSILNGTGMCTPRVARMAACRSSRQCMFGDVCDGDVCVPRQPIAGPCVTETGCWSRACDRGLCVVSDLCQ
jgi:hypothetical protein